MLYNVIEEAPSPESADQDTLARYFTAFDEQFFSFCDRELKKINTFYSGTPEITFEHLGNPKEHPSYGRSLCF